MAQLIVGIAIGVALGAVSGILWSSRRVQSAPGDLAEARTSLEAAKVRMTDLQSTIERERVNHSQALSGLEDRFKVLASDTLNEVVQRHNDGQVQALEQREHKIDARLDPISELLREYKSKVDELELKRDTGYLNVENAAKQLLDAQRKSMEETQKLNTILGRSSARGRWGEVQLQRILEIAGMTKYVDYDEQVTVSGSDDTRQRPDVIVNLPHGAQIAIDSKVPFDAYDRAISSDDDAERDAALRDYAAAMRQHVNELKKREYWSALKISPAFAVCFVPSDALLGAAFNADDTLFNDAIRSRVLIAGPTTLLSLLWSTWLGWSQFEAAQNIGEITDLATRLVDRAVVVHDHASKLGRSLDASTKNFNNLVGSLEASFLVTVRDMQEKGVPNHKAVETIDALPALSRPLNRDRWPLPDEDVVETIDAQIVPALNETSGEAIGDDSNI